MKNWLVLITAIATLASLGCVRKNAPQVQAEAEEQVKDTTQKTTVVEVKTIRQKLKELETDLSKQHKRLSSFSNTVANAFTTLQHEIDMHSSVTNLLVDGYTQLILSREPTNYLQVVKYDEELSFDHYDHTYSFITESNEVVYVVIRDNSDKVYNQYTPDTTVSNRFAQMKIIKAYGASRGSEWDFQYHAFEGPIEIQDGDVLISTSDGRVLGRKGYLSARYPSAESDMQSNNPYIGAWFGMDNGSTNVIINGNKVGSYTRYHSTKRELSHRLMNRQKVLTEDEMLDVCADGLMSLWEDMMSYCNARIDRKIEQLCTSGLVINGTNYMVTPIAAKVFPVTYELDRGVAHMDFMTINQDLSIEFDEGNEQPFTDSQYFVVKDFSMWDGVYIVSYEINDTEGTLMVLNSTTLEVLAVQDSNLIVGARLLH